MGIEKDKLIRSLDNPDTFNEVMNDSDYDFDDKKSLEILKIDVENNKDLILRKKTALLQAIDLLDSIISYGELDSEINNLKESVKDADFNLEQLENDLEQLNTR